MSKPQTALEAIALKEEIRRALKEDRTYAGNAGSPLAIITKVKRENLVKHLDNWNRFVATTDIELIRALLKLYEKGVIQIYNKTINIPLTKFSYIISSIGLNRRGDLIETFNLPVVGNKVECSRLKKELPSSYPMVCGGDEEIRRTMRISPNAFPLPVDVERAERLFKTYASRLLVPSRIWWDTAHAIALFADKPVIANMFFMVRLRVKKEIEDMAGKALALWLNTTWGLLTILLNRQETRGRWSSLEIGQWRALRVLDVTKLEVSALRKLAESFDRWAGRELRRLPQQFSDDLLKSDEVRKGIDMDFIRVFEPDINEDLLKDYLNDLYRRVKMILEQWITG